MDKTELRYLIEHRYLPQAFFEDAEGLVGMFLDDQSFIYHIFKEEFEKNGMEMPYEEDDFTIMFNRISDKAMVEMIELPVPEKEPLCYLICLFFNEAFDKIGYYCVEGNETGDNTPFICSWDENGKHINHGKGTDDTMENIILCADHYMKEHFNLVRDKSISVN